MPTIRSTSRSSWSCRSARRAFAEALRCGAEIFHTLKKGLHDAGLSTAVGDEGGFAPDLASARDALDFIMTLDRAGGLQARRRRRARARLRRDRILQATAPTGWKGRAGRSRPTEMADYLAELCRRLSDRLDRGRHGRGRSRRLEGADRPARRPASSWSATICSSPTRSGSRWASSRASPIRS